MSNVTGIGRVKGQDFFEVVAGARVVGLSVREGDIVLITAEGRGEIVALSLWSGGVDSGMVWQDEEIQAPEGAELADYINEWFKLL